MKIKYLISASWILTVDSNDQILHDHAIAIQHEKIVDILPLDEAKQKYQPEQQFHLENQALLPGLVNTHTHAAMSLLKGLADDLPLMEWLEKHIWPAEGRWADADFVYDGSKLAIAEMLRSGTTCFNDMYFFPESTAKAVEESGIRATLGMILVDFPTAYAQSPDEYFKHAKALNQYCADKPTLSTLFAPHAPYTVSDEPLKEVKKLAEALSVPIHMHVHETAFEVMQASENSGDRPLARLNKLDLLDQHFLAVHMTQLEDDEISLLAKKGTHVVHCPESNMKLASGFCPVAKLLEAGVNVALGTDGSASNNDLDLLGEMRTAALIGKGFSGDATVIPAKQALRMATINGAKALGLDKMIGSLEIGKSADLIAIDFSDLETQPLYDPVSHLVYCTSRNQVTHSWVNGRLLMESRQLKTLNIDSLVSNAKEWQARMETFDSENNE
uniref:5-methylthioadenosine/S-adenosylhomocysteine deaminase n=1 Tax=uncultured Thiotrichaceae bacterium TaxID=298394 RepID=A0A6S6U5P1_9GAMM|nr:MAG: S-adenosylhomocysteine deaminase (EC; Methylthioadenosine deaminase [uncultured Thiotrichaceae bacterium]